MSWKTILTHLDESPSCAGRADIAAGLACAFSAHAVGLAVTPPLAIPGSGHAEVVIRLLTEQWERHRAAAAARATQFSETCTRAGVASVESRTAVGEAGEVIALHARYADLVVIGQPGAEGGPDSGFAETVLLTSGRPVLMLPNAGTFAQVGTNILVAWNASAQATRALTDALPLLARAGRVHVLTVNAGSEDDGHGEVPGADIALWLSRHGVKAEVDETWAADVDIGEWLLSRAADLGVDLIVMGAYGHSRLRELVLGGATRTMLASMTVPVLMSH